MLSASRQGEWFLCFLIGYQLLGCVWKQRDDLLAEKMDGLVCVFVTFGPFIDGRTTGIEHARGGFTIHCLDPLGYIRPYPRTGFSLYLRSDPFRTPMTAIKEKLFPILYTKSLFFRFILELGFSLGFNNRYRLPGLQRLGCSLHWFDFTLLNIQIFIFIGGRRAVKAHLVDSERAASTYSYPIQQAPQQNKSEARKSLFLNWFRESHSCRTKSRSLFMKRTPKLQALKPLLLSIYRQWKKRRIFLQTFL